MCNVERKGMRKHEVLEGMTAYVWLEGHVVSVRLTGPRSHSVRVRNPPKAKHEHSKRQQWPPKQQPKLGCVRESSGSQL